MSMCRHMCIIACFVTRKNLSRSILRKHVVVFEPAPCIRAATLYGKDDFIQMGRLRARSLLINPPYRQPYSVFDVFEKSSLEL